MSPAEDLVVTVDLDACCSSGRCSVTEPRVFDQDERDGTVILLRSIVGPELRDSVLLCQSLCPCDAITISEPT